MNKSFKNEFILSFSLDISFNSDVFFYRMIELRRITCACHRINTVLSDMFVEKYVRENYGEDAVTRLEPLYRMLDESKTLVSYFKRTGLMKQLKKSLKQHVSSFTLSNSYRWPL